MTWGQEHRSARFDAPPFVVPTIAAVALAYCVALLHFGGTPAARGLSNFGLCVTALAAGSMSLRRRVRVSGTADRRFWTLLGAAMISWGLGQAVWAWYETVLRQEVPFPSPSDIGYLGLPPLAIAALLALPLSAQSWASRLRTLLDGLLVAASLFLCSWMAVLGPVFRAGADNVVGQLISVSYPAGDVVLITMVVYVWLRSRHSSRSLPVSLPFVGSGLVFFGVADSGFVYQTTTGTYSSGNVIDLGWFAGFVILLLTTLRTAKPSAESVEEELLTRTFNNLLPYAAVSLALVTSSIEVLRNGHLDTTSSWLRTGIMLLLVVRQLLTLRENHALTRTLEDRVVVRTAELQASQERFSALVQHSSDVVTVIDAHGRIQYQSASSDRVLGYAPESLTGTSVFDLLGDDTRRALLATAIEHASAEHMRVHTVTSTWRHADGHPCQMEVTLTNLLDHPHVRGLVLNTRDVTERVALESQLTGMAFTDSLTGLANRALFKDRLQHALERRTSGGNPVSVLFMDLDGFKSVNDTIGHSAGDQLLVEVAARLREVVGGADTVARFGGDEFAVLLEDQEDDGYQLALAERITERLREPVELQGDTVHIAASVGIAQCDEEADTAEQLLRNADLAMYQAKAAGEGGFTLFEQGMHAGLVERMRLESDLRRAAENCEFVVHYQPMVSMRTGEITGSEALVRWQHPTRGLLQPNDFIEAAESTGVIRILGLQVLREACEQTAVWQRGLAGSTRLKISVNVSPRQLVDTAFPDQVRAVLEETGLAPELLTLEMTEGILIEDRSETITALEALRAVGVRLAIDDFGTGYSSLSYLHRFPVDVLKIDRSFVQRLGGVDANGGDDGALVSTILHLGQSLHLETVAEGIERPQEMLILRRQGCTTGQGFHFSPPVDQATITAMLAEQAQGLVEPVA